jgi:ribosomal protein L11 methyltransferase
MNETMHHHLLFLDAPEEEALLIAAALESFAAPAPQSVSARQMGGHWRVEAIFDAVPDERALARFLNEVAPGVRFTIAPLADEDWVALSQAQLPPIRTRKFYVRGEHVALPADLGACRVITIDGGMAFGTGHHASTLGCLMALENLQTCSPPPSPLPQGEGGIIRRWPRRVLDLGTGSGLLAIAAAKLWPAARVTASDIDSVAIEVARENCRLNGAPGVRLVTAAGFHHVGLRARFDLITANILAKPLMRLAREIAAHVSPGGRVILAGLLSEQAAEIVARYRLAGLSLIVRRDREGWATLVLAPGAGKSSSQVRCERRPA